MKPSQFFLLASLCLQLCTSMTIITKPHPDEIPSEPNSHPQEQLIHSPKAPQQTTPQTTFKQLTNGSTPTGWIQIGTPKKWLYVIFDTGSDKLVAKTWETIAAELDTVDQGVTKDMIMPSDTLYNHDGSSSYLRRYMTDPTTGGQQPMQSSITYGSGTAITDVGADDIHVGARTLKNFTIMEITADSLQMLHTSKGIAGVLGLQHMKNKSLGNSLFSHLRDENLITSFAYCRGELQGAGNNGTFIWGAPEPEGENVHEAEVIGQMHWAVKLGDIKLQNSTGTTGDTTGGSTGGSTGSSTGGWIQKTAKVVQPSDADGQSGDSSGGASGGGPLFDTPSDDSSTQAQSQDQTLANVCPNGGCTGILDTGSNIIAGPSNIMQSITATVNVSPDCSNFDSLPDILLNFGGNPVTIKPSGYVMMVPKPSDPYGMDAGGDASGGDGSADGSGGAGFVNGAGLEQKAVTTERARRAAIKRQWQMVFHRLHKNTGIDLRDIANHVLKQENATKEEFLCMPALVPIDRDTVNGPLYIVGTPLLDSYYARWSFDKDAQSPKIHLQPLEDAEICKDTSDLHKGDGFSKFTAKSLVRKEATGSTKEAIRTDTHRGRRGPTTRRPEEIRFPHWAKSLMHV